MAPETELLWEITLGLGVVVVAVVILLLALLREVGEGAARPRGPGVVVGGGRIRAHGDGRQPGGQGRATGAVAMTVLLTAATVVVVFGLFGVVAAFLWVIGTMVLDIAEILSGRVAPGAQAVASHVRGMAPALEQLERSIADADHL